MKMLFVAEKTIFLVLSFDVRLLNSVFSDIL